MFDRLIKAINEKKNPAVMGLDPLLEYVPQPIVDECIAQYGKTPKAAGEALFAFNKGLIDCAYDLIPAVKPQAAFYEKYGIEGMIALDRTIQYAKQAGLYVILDIKRNDIGTTAQAYADAYLGQTDVFGEKVSFTGADCVTVNGYLGSDGIKPFVDTCLAADGAIFALVKTSNKSSGELQDKLCGEKSIYLHMADLVDGWNVKDGSKSGYGCVGAVVGATYPEQLNELRAQYPKMFFLVPGYGAQGGKADDIMGAFDKEGNGAIINSSRGLMCAHMKKSDPANFQKHTRDAVLAMKQEISPFS